VSETYRIADEPTPGRLGRLVVDPFWPLLGVMLAGFWLALPWFALNAAAMGSATRRREWAWLAGGLAISAVAGSALLYGIDHSLVGVRTARYAAIGLVAWRLAVAYAVFSLQQASFELHRHFGGAARNGVLVVVLAAVVSPATLVGKHGATLLAFLVG
jgi:hypothetical protein